MKKIYMTFLLLMIAIVSFAEDEVVKNGIRYNLKFPTLVYRAFLSP